jgi:hypothetical protein
MVLKCIGELNFEDKVFVFILDNATNNGGMVQMITYQHERERETVNVSFYKITYQHQIK